jgi:starvation-inducible DNA-binding protein
LLHESEISFLKAQVHCRRAETIANRSNFEQLQLRRITSVVGKIPNDQRSKDAENLQGESKTMVMSNPIQLRESDRETTSDLGQDAMVDISEALRRLLADIFVLFVKTKNFHWHMSGRNFRDYHLLLDEHAGQIFAMTDDIAERARKLGGTTLRSIGDISHHQRLKDNNKESITPKEMLEELCADNQALARFLRSTHELCDRYFDVATTSLIEVWIDETERRRWFLAEIISDL